jgi:hypothetical protein
MDQIHTSPDTGVENTVTITEIIDDLRASEEMIHRFERRYWLSSADFYDLYQQGKLDDGENSEDFTLWAGYYLIKVDREASLQSLSRERAAQLRAMASEGAVQIRPVEPMLQIA